MKRSFLSPLLGFALLFSLALPALAVKKGQAKYMGGTLNTIKEKAEGPIDLSNEKRLTFIPKDSAMLEIPWDRVSQLEYGQNVARRWRSAILLSPIALFSKAKKHFVTITYQDKDKVEQAIVLEFDKDDIRMVLASLKARTLQTIVMQDEEAKKDLGGTIEKK
jgi:hypothetical protein